MKIEAIAWDIDGTLIDSEPTHLKALIATCDGYGVDISDLPEDTFVGVSVHGVWEALVRRFPARLGRDEWIARINDHYRKLRRELRIQPFAVETILKARDLGLRQVAVSNSNRSVVDVNLEMLGASGIFDFSLSLDDVAKGKPDPTPYRLAANRLGLVPQQVVAVEDSETGLRSAAAAGCLAVAISADGVRLSPADRRITGLDELPEILAAARSGLATA
ncbi:HAD family phosphatase [Pelagibius sp. CAU 1746]|uniref:HAD family hydrolase n=1 Tax=Pelagibius sp. CAU 1746 TaxID=3140370 RepID=UPI00325A5D4A